MQTIAERMVAFHFSKPKDSEFHALHFADYTVIDSSKTDPEGNTRGFSPVQAPDEPDLVAATRMRAITFNRVLKDLPIGDRTLHKTESTLTHRDRKAWPRLCEPCWWASRSRRRISGPQSSPVIDWVFADRSSPSPAGRGPRVSAG